MSTASIIVIIAVAALVIVAVAAYSAVRTRRRRTLQQQFGSEYDRAVSDSGSRRTAERDLQERAERRDHLDITPLPSAAVERYQERWELVQHEFVDAPVAAVTQAHELVTSVMADRGYPTSDRDERTSLLSVDHANVVQRYREAVEIKAASQSNEASTEELRQAMTHYRALFERLLEDSDAGQPVQR